MNSATLVGSLIFAAVLVVVIAVVIQLMMRGWRRRAERQEQLIGDLPDIPDALGAATTYLKLMGDTVGGWMLAKGADDGDRTNLARFYAAQVLTGANGLADTVEAGAAGLEHAQFFAG